MMQFPSTMEPRIVNNPTKFLKRTIVQFEGKTLSAPQAKRNGVSPTFFTLDCRGCSFFLLTPLNYVKASLNQNISSIGQ